MSGDRYEVMEDQQDQQSGKESWTWNREARKQEGNLNLWSQAGTLLPLLYPCLFLLPTSTAQVHCRSRLALCCRAAYVSEKMEELCSRWRSWPLPSKWACRLVTTHEMQQHLAPYTHFHSILVAASRLPSRYHVKFSWGHCQEEERGILGHVIQTLLS